MTTTAATGAMRTAKVAPDTRREPSTSRLVRLAPGRSNEAALHMATLP